MMSIGEHPLYNVFIQFCFFAGMLGIWGEEHEVTAVWFSMLDNKRLGIFLPIQTSLDCVVVVPSLT